MSRSDEGIEAIGLRRVFKDIEAVAGIDLRVLPGEIYGFLGPNGAGKSTTVHMLTTLLPPSGGRATVAGFDVAKQGPQVRASIGAALQEAALDPFLTGREHLRLQATLHGLRGATASARSPELLERVGLTEAADRKVRTYSGGMKRRLDLGARAHPRPRRSSSSTSRRPASTRRAGPRSGTRSRRLAREEGVTVFLTTQYLEEADVLADRVGIIDHGHIVAEGTPAAAEGEIGRPTVEVVPTDPTTSTACAAVFGRFGETVRATRGVAVRLRRPRRSWPRSCARSTPRACASPDSTPRADARRRVPREDGPHARRRR